MTLPDYPARNLPQCFGFDIGPKIGPDPADSGYDAGGWLQGGGYTIPSVTLHPAPQLTPEQVAAYTRVIELARRWQVRDTG